MIVISMLIIPDCNYPRVMHIRARVHPALAFFSRHSMDIVFNAGSCCERNQISSDSMSENGNDAKH